MYKQACRNLKSRNYIKRNVRHMYSFYSLSIADQEYSNDELTYMYTFEKIVEVYCFDFVYFPMKHYPSLTLHFVLVSSLFPVCTGSTLENNNQQLSGESASRNH